MLDAIKDAVRKSSIHVCIVNCGGCNGCDVECVALLSPRYDLEQYGIYVHNNPREADVLLLTGAVTEQWIDNLKRIYDKAPEPKIAVAVGNCPVSGDVFNQEGIVLIDEIETHLHLSLQKMIMPFLTGVFPNIQFIVTTHSPFVLSSMPNAVAYDLEHQEVISDLTEYSYEALAEGYFGVKTSSSYTEMRLNDFRLLLEKGQWSEADKIKIKNLNEDFKKIPELVSPLIVGEYKRLAIQYADKLMTLQK